MADPNNMLIHEHRLVLMLICKSGNTSIKWAVAEAMGLGPTHRTDLYFPTPNIENAMSFADEGYLALSVIRHPLARLASCWRDKVADPNRFHRPFRHKYGGAIIPGMSFGDWVRFVAETPDGIADQHFRSMSWDLVFGDWTPETIRIERPDWWADLRGRIRSHCGLDIGAQRHENSTGGDWQGEYTMELRRIACDRYREDLERFGYDA